MDELLADPGLCGPCADCGKKIQVLWCALWDAYLCCFCRANHTALDLATGKKKWAPGAGPR